MNILHEGLLRLGFDKGEFFGIKILPLEELESKMEKYMSPTKDDVTSCLNENMQEAVSAKN